MKFKILMCSTLIAAMMLAGCSKPAESTPASTPEVSTSESASSDATSETADSSTAPEVTSEPTSDAVDTVDEKPEGDLEDKDYLETFGIDRINDKQTVINELTTKYPSEDFQSLSTARMLYQLGWDPLHKVNFAGALAPDASCIVYLEFDTSQKEYAETCLGNYVNWLKTELVDECETETDTLRLNNVTYEVRDTSAIFIFPGVWKRDPGIDAEPTPEPGTSEAVDSASSEAESEAPVTYTEQDMYEYGIEYAINDIKASLGF